MLDFGHRLGIAHHFIFMLVIWQIIFNGILRHKYVDAWQNASFPLSLLLNCLVAWLLGFDELQSVNFWDFNLLLLPGLFLFIGIFVIAERLYPEIHHVGLANMRSRERFVRVKQFAAALFIAIVIYIVLVALFYTGSIYNQCDIKTCFVEVILGGSFKYTYGPLLVFSFLDFPLTVAILLVYSFFSFGRPTITPVV